MAASEEEARAIIMEGRLFTGGRKIDKPGDKIPAGAGIKVIPGRRYVSRGGFKLEGIREDISNVHN